MVAQILSIGAHLCLWENLNIVSYLPVIREPNYKEMGKRLKTVGVEGNIDRQGGYSVHPAIEVDGDKASCRWLLYMLMSYRLTQQLMFYLQKIYEVEYIRENGKWKIYQLKLSHRQGPQSADGGFYYPGT